MAVGAAGQQSVGVNTARAPVQPACAPERQGRVQARSAPESAQGRPAALARDLRRAASRAGIDAEATRQATRGEVRNREALWRLRAQEEGRLPAHRPAAKAGNATRLSRNESLAAWKRIAMTLAHSDSLDDRKLARQIIAFVKDMPMLRKQAAPTRDVQRSGVQPEHARRGPEIERWSGSVQTDERVLAAGPASPLNQ